MPQDSPYREGAVPEKGGDRIIDAHLSPADQPNRVHDIAALLLAAYAVEGGHAHLAGCTLDDVPVVRLTWNTEENSSESMYVIVGPASPEGRNVDDELFATLNLSNLVESQRPFAISPRDVARIVESSVRVAVSSQHATDPDEIALVWCKYARGKVQFTIGSATAQTPFAGWARTLKPPPFRCETTGVEAYSLAATSDGRIVAADQLATCDVSGQRLPRCEMVRCAATGKLVAIELTSRCPVTHERVLTEQTVICPMCQQKVSPTALKRNRCASCASLSTVRRDDDRMIRLLARYDGLANWKWLRLAESDSVFTVVASGFLDRRLLVVDKTSLDVLRAARSTRWSQAWIDEKASDLKSFW